MQLPAGDLIVRIVASLGGLGFIVPVFSFYWANVRMQARVASVVDLASKRLAFWDQFSQVRMAATAAEDQAELKEKLRSAIDKVQVDADRELERIAWKSKVASHFQGKIRLPKKPFRELSFFEWAEYVGTSFFATLYMIIGFASFGLILFRCQLENFVAGNQRCAPYPLKAYLILDTLGVFFFFGGIIFLRQALSVRLKAALSLEVIDRI